jgi:hypothetical protein
MATGAVRSHHAPTSTKRWDGSATEARLPDNERAFRKEFAYVDPQKPHSKTAAKFPHHDVDREGRVGAANVKACISGVAVLNGGRGGADITKEARRGIYRHLAMHLRDAGKEPAELAG